MLTSTMDKASTIVGTPYYLSPEIVQNKEYGLETDIWSIGVILYEMCMLKPPFDARSISSLAVKITTGTYQPIPPQYSKDLKLLVTSLLSVDPCKRPNIHRVLRNPFIQSRIQTFMSQTRYNMMFTNSLNKKNSKEGITSKVKELWDKPVQHNVVRPQENKPTPVHQKNPVIKESDKVISHPRKEKTKPVVKQQPVQVKHSEPEHTKHPEPEHVKHTEPVQRKWEEESRKMKEDIKKLKQKNKGAKQDADIHLVTHSYSSTNDTAITSDTTVPSKKENVKQEHLSAKNAITKNVDSPSTKKLPPKNSQSGVKNNPVIDEDNKNHRPTQIEKGHAGGLREEIMKRRQQNKCPKSAFENFSEKDILVSKIKIKEQTLLQSEHSLHVRICNIYYQ